MKLKQVYDALGHLHLTSVAVSNEGIGLKSIDYPEINVAINHAIQDISNKFDLSVKEIFVRLLPGKVEYLLTKEHADSYQGDAIYIPWIEDSKENPFLGDIKYIRSITTGCGEDLIINSPNVCNSVLTPSYNTIQICESTLCTNKYLSVVYTAEVQQLPITTDLAPETIDVDIPSPLFNLLIKGVVKYYFKSKAGKDMYFKGVQAENEYNVEELKIQSLGFYSENFSENETFNKDGWV